MITNLLQDIPKIYIVYGATDFRKQTYSLCNIVKQNYRMNPYDKSAYIFCNKKRNSIRVLCYDKNEFILAQKTLLDTEKMVSVQRKRRIGNLMLNPLRILHEVSYMPFL